MRRGWLVVPLSPLFLIRRRILPWLRHAGRRLVQSCTGSGDGGVGGVA